MPEIKVLDKANNKLVTRRNDLIEARYRLTIQEQRLMLWVLSNIEPEDEDLKVYRVSVNDLADLIGITNKDIYARLRATTKKLMGRVIEIEEDNRLMQRPLINQADYYKGEGIIDIRVDEDLKKYLIQLKDNFTKIRLKYAFRLTSTYSLRIYEILVQYQKIGSRTEAVSRLREMLDIEPEKYDRWANFETYVLKVAHKEINEKTDVRFDYEKIKKGRSIHAIKFTLKSKQTQLLESPTPDQSVTELESELLALGFDKKLAKEYAKKWPERVKNALQGLKKDKTITNPSGWLRRHIEGNWQDSGELAKKKAKEAEKSRLRTEAIREEAERKQKAENDSYIEYLKTTISEYIDSLPVNREKALRKEFRGQGFGLFDDGKRFKTKEVWTSPMFVSQAQEFLSKQEGLSFETKDDYIANMQS